MYLRWKDGPTSLRVSLVRSVRRNGQPRQEIIGSFSVPQNAEEKAALAWNQLEDQFVHLTLVAEECDSVRQLFAQRIPRPSDADLQARRRLSEQQEAERKDVYRQFFGEDWQQHQARVVPPTPPRFSNEPLHEPYLVTWKVEQPRPKFREPARYTAFLARGVLEAKKPLKLGDISAPALTGTITHQGKVIVSHEWQTFWYTAHHVLVAAAIAVEVYQQIMRHLAYWVKRPSQEEMVTIVEGHLYSEQLGLKRKQREVEGALHRYLARSRIQEAVLSHSPEYLGVEAIHPHWVR